MVDLYLIPNQFIFFHKESLQEIETINCKR